MNSSAVGLGWLAATAVVFSTALAWSAAPPTGPESEAGHGSAGKAESARPITVAEARERAKLMHAIHSATLEALHHHYFRREGAVLPARAMDDVFAEVNKATKIKTRWIAVNTPAMSVDHKPQTAFEEDAAAALGSGHDAFERVVKGVYHRAGVIPLGSGCVSCHTRFGAPPTKKQRVAGLVISIPVKSE